MVAGTVPYRLAKCVEFIVYMQLLLFHSLCVPL